MDLRQTYVILSFCNLKCSTTHIPTSSNVNFNQQLSQSFDWINCIHLSSPLESLKLLASLYLKSSSTNFDDELNRHLRSHNNALTTTHIHRFINVYFGFNLLLLHIKNKCCVFEIRRNFGGSPKPLSPNQLKHPSFY